MMTFRDFRLPLGVCLCFLVCRTTISKSTDNPTVCDFDQSTLCGYTQDKTDNFDWTRNNGYTQTPSTGPNNDHTTGNSTGHYMYIETSAPKRPNDIARLISPSYNLKGSEIQCLTFWYSMNGETIKTLNVYVTASGQTNNRGSPAWTLSGNQGYQWKQAKFTIFPTGNYQIVFEGIRGENYRGDIAIDDIMVTIGDCNGTDCRGTPLVSNGIVSQKNSTPVFHLECLEGYRSTQGNEIRCLWSGNWTFAECRPVDCGPWPGLANSSVNQIVTYLNSTLFGAIVLMTCDAGYHVFNNSSSHNESAVCTLNGTWSPSTYSQCIPIDCGQWSSNSSVRSHQKIIYTNATVFGSEVVMKCNQGYHVVNTNKSRTESAVCQENGTWSSQTYSECVPTDCGEWSSNSSVRSHRNIIYTNATLFGSEVVMTCNQGYHVVNTNKSQTESAVCQENGTWSSQTNSECVPTDCGEWSTNSSVLANQNIKYPNSTSYGSQAVMTCDPGYHVVNKIGTRSESAVCTENGIWSTQTFSDCIPIDCGRLPNPSNGYVFAKASTYESTATIKCHKGYTLQGGSTSSCGRNGEWSSTGQTCSLIECPVLDPNDKLTIELDPNTTKPIVNTTAMFSCPPSSSLVGYKTIQCTINGRWTGPVPKCIMLDKTVRNCSVDDDTKNRTWRETQPGAIVVENCPNGYSGEISRQCSEEGRWLNPFYNCVSERVAQLLYEVKSIEEAPSTQKITHSLDQLVNLTKPTNGTSYIGELNAITNMLDIIASVSGNIEITDEQANSFFAATSNLLDYDNAESWKSGDDHNEINGSPDRSSTANPGAMKVLNVVDKYADILMNTLANNSESSKTIQMDNMVVHVSKVNTTIDDLKFPDKPVNITSSVILPKASLIGSNSIAAVVYRNLTGIVSSKLKNDSDYTINSEVVTVTLDNWENTTNFFLDITMDYAQNLHSAPICSFWNTTLFAWDTTGCLVMSSNHSSATCRCTHLTNFAILMSPFIQSRASTKHLDIISIVGCSISLAGLVLTITFHIALWRYVSKRRVAVLLNLSVALIIAYVMFIGGIDRTESKIICTTLASLLHYIYLVVFSLMLVEGIDVAVSILIVFQTQSKLKWMLSAAWVVPAVIVGITLGVTKTEGYGNERSCWLTIKGGVIWAFVGPALLVVLVNFIILVFVIRATLRSYTMAKKSTVERSKSAVWCLLVLLPLMGLTWVLGVFYLDESMAWVQYAFAVCNSLQGLVIFMFHCAFNKTLWKAYKTKKQRSSYASSTYLKSRSTSVRSVITENSEVSMNVNDTFEIPSVDESANTRYKDLPIKQPMQTAAQADKEEQVDGFRKHSGDNTTDDKLRRNGDEETVNTNSNDVGLENPADKFLFSTTL